MRVPYLHSDRQLCFSLLQCRLLRSHNPRHPAQHNHDGQFTFHQYNTAYFLVDVFQITLKCRYILSYIIPHLRFNTIYNLYTKRSVTYLSQDSMATTHLQRPSAAVDAVLIFSGSNSGFEVYFCRIVFIMAGAMLSLSQLCRLFKKFMSPSSFLEGPQKSSIFFPKSSNKFSEKFSGLRFKSY